MSAGTSEGRISTRPASSHRPTEEDCRCLDVGLQVVLTRLQKTWPTGAFYALSDTCTHRGGPLSEGAEEGTEVTCPWRGAGSGVAGGGGVAGARPADGAGARADHLRMSGGTPGAADARSRIPRR